MKTLLMPGNLVQIISSRGCAPTLGIIAGAYEGNYGIEFVILYRGIDGPPKAIITTRPLDWIYGKVLL